MADLKQLEEAVIELADAIETGEHLDMGKVIRGILNPDTPPHHRPHATEEATELTPPHHRP